MYRYLTVTVQYYCSVTVIVLTVKAGTSGWLNFVLKAWTRRRRSTSINNKSPETNRKSIQKQKQTNKTNTLSMSNQEVENTLRFSDRCHSHSRFRFGEVMANPVSLLGCCALRQESSAAIGWRGDTTNRCPSLIGQSVPGCPDRPPLHWMISSQPGGGAPSSDNH